MPINRKVASFENEDTNLVVTLTDGTVLELEMTLELIDELEVIVEDFKGDLTPFLYEEMTLLEVAELYKCSASEIIDTIVSYAYRR